ncbi:MAG TPA: hypothetical protein V6C52_00540 [Coleofasciculaceae cyanobacterium]|jgi:hypothetical protein
MQTSRLQSFQQSIGGVSGQRSQKANPFNLNSSRTGSVDDNALTQDRQDRNSNNGVRNNASDQAKQERIKQLQTRIDTEGRELAKLQAMLSEQSRSASGQRSDQIQGFQLSMGAKTAQIGNLQQSLSQEMTSGSIGGFVGQQGDGSGLRLSVQA